MKPLIMLHLALFLISPLLAQHSSTLDQLNEDKALILLVRPGGLGIVFSTSINNELLGMTNGADYLFKEAEPGSVEILTAGGEGHHTMSLAAEAGKVYVVKIGQKAGFLAPTPRMKLMKPEWAWKRLDKLKLGTFSSTQAVSAN
jgi:hypothetical protein